MQWFVKMKELAGPAIEALPVRAGVAGALEGKDLPEGRQQRRSI